VTMAMGSSMRLERGGWWTGKRVESI
jgi:hypothetical protein